MNAIRAIVTDIEGTTSSLSFVKDVLFPYARQHLPAYVRQHEEDVADVLQQVRAMEGNPGLSAEDIIATFTRWIDEDKKATPLKELQGRIWQAGYAAGDFQGHIYDDAVQALKRWHASGIALYVYSSGSIAAQKLLFGHTPYGDLTPLFSGYFDTTTGPKLEAESYRKITASIALPASRILFLSDHSGEIEAAANAGMKTILVQREEESPALDCMMVRDFNSITLLEKAA